ncbi:MAG: DUF4173 domain-containing protein, partial [Bacillota bacterium]|nr:DUF4173 domain-containing protein [Bacillota bacterium]
MSEFSTKNENQTISVNKGFFILITSLIISIIFNILFYGKIPGISCIIFVSFSYSLFFINFKNSFKAKINFQNLVFLFILLLSLYYSLFANEIFTVLNVMVLFVLILIHTMLSCEKNTREWFQFSFINDILYGLFYGMFAYIFKPITVLANIKVFNKPDNKNNNVKKVFIGLIISLPLLLIIILLLSSADAVFGNFMSSFTKIFKNINMPEVIGRSFIIVIIFAFTFSYLWFLSLPKNEINKNRVQRNYSNINEISSSNGININNEAGLKKSLSVFDPIIVITVLVSINLVYLLFTMIQFTYLFGSINHNLPQNLTYAEYARKGFFELVLVTLINLIIILATGSFTKINSNKIYAAVKVLNSFLVFCTGVMLFSAHFRMSLYEETYGYTYLRIFTHAFMIFIFVLLIISLIKIWNQKLVVLKYYIIVSLIAYILINFVNVDSIIAKNNIERYHHSEEIDVSYLTQLSYDAVPQLLDFLPEL